MEGTGPLAWGWGGGHRTPYLVVGWRALDPLLGGAVEGTEPLAWEGATGHLAWGGGGGGGVEWRALDALLGGGGGHLS